jgi:hypothetical protein
MVVAAKLAVRVKGRSVSLSEEPRDYAKYRANFYAK